MATATMRKSSSCQTEHQVASLENGLTMPPSSMVTAQQQQQQPNSRVSASHSYDSGYNEAIARDEDSPTTEASAVADVFSPATAVSLGGNCNKLRQRPIRMPSVIVSDCSDIANPDSFSELVICNGAELDFETINHHQDHNPPSPFSPASSSHSQSTSPSQEMDPADQQGWSYWPPTLRNRSSSSGPDGFLVLPGQEEDPSSSNLLFVRRLSDCSSSSSLATLDMEPCCSGRCMRNGSSGHDVDDDSQTSPPPSSANSSPSSVSPDPLAVDADERIKTSSNEASGSTPLSDLTHQEEPSDGTSSPSPLHHSSSVKVSAWRKVRSAVQWSPFVQTFRRQRYPWVQLAGHQGNFKVGGERGTILKKLCPKEESCFQMLMNDPLRPFIPSYKGHVASDDGEKFLVLEDLLGSFSNPSVMDCKLGVRTYLEDELAKAKLKPKLRKDMFEKMLQVDPSAPTTEELQLGGVTKPRYMVWRETISSTASLGFRIEGIRKQDGSSSKDFKTVGSAQQILTVFREFVQDHPHALTRYTERLRELSAILATSQFFANHELIGSSLLFIHDQNKANIWMIDFAKTHPLPPGIQIDHRSPWRVGNHEDGYLIGLANLTQLFDQLSLSTTDPT